MTSVSHNSVVMYAKGQFEALMEVEIGISLNRNYSLKESQPHSKHAFCCIYSLTSK